jgi:hypothetical protein
MTNDASNGSQGPTLVPAAVVAGALLALAVVVPAGVLQVLIDVPSVRWLLFAVILGGFAAGGYRAAGLAAVTPLTNAATAALAAFAVAQGAAVLIGLASGNAVQWAALAFLALLATSCGMIGAWFRLRTGTVGRNDTPPRV